MVKTSLTILLTAILFFSCTHFHAKAVKSFEGYKIKEIYTGPKAPINNKDLEDNSSFKTRIIEGYKKDINYAGKYVWIQWGCGSGCQVNLMVNAETGKIFYPPVSALGVEYKVDSTMIIVDPFSEDYKENDRPEIYEPPTYYNFNGEQFIEIK